MIKSMLLGFIGVGAVGAFAICDLCQPAAEAATVTELAARVEAAPVTTPVADPEEITLEVEGMTCGGCAIAARTVLERLDGVQEAEVSYEDSRAVVTYESEAATVEQMIAALKELGYTASVVEDVEEDEGT